MKRVFIGLFCLSVSCSIFLSAGCGGSGAKSLAQALALVESGDYAEATPLLEKAAEEFPESASAWCNLGVCYLAQDRANDAISALRKGVDLASGSAEAYEYLGRAYLAAGSLDDAREVLVTANTIEPGNPRILTAIGVVEMKAGKLKAAFASTMDALDIDSAYAPALYNIAVLYRDQLKNKQLAEKFFRRFLAAAPSDPRASEAQAFLNPQAAVRESPAKGLVEKAKRHMQDEDYDAAIVALTEAIKKDPGYSEAVWNMAILADHIMGDTRRGADYYEEFRTKFPNDKRSPQAKRRAEELREALAKAASQSSARPETPSDSAAIQSAAQALAAGVEWQEKGDPAKAEEFYKKAIEIDGSMTEAFYNLGVLYYKTKNLEGARAALGTAVTLKEEYINARYMLAAAQYELGDKAGAAQNLNTVLIKEPDFAKAHYLLGVILAENKQLKASKIHFDRYALLTGRNAR